MRIRLLVAVVVLVVIPLVGSVAAGQVAGHPPSERSLLLPSPLAVAPVGGPPRQVSAPSDPGADAGPPPTVLIYGDSLLWEAQDQVRSLIGDGATVELESFGGTALCDYADRSVERARVTGARLVVFQFSGNAFTPCMQGARDLDVIAERYRADAEAVTAQLASIGAAVAFVTPPPSLVCRPDAAKTFDERADGALPAGCRDRVHPLEAVYRDVAEDGRDRGFAVTAVDGTRNLTGPAGGWTKVLPCDADEGPAQGCVDGLIDVRAADNGHFCPQVATSSAGVIPGCLTYSAGAARFAATIATAVTAAVPDLTRGT